METLFAIFKIFLILLVAAIVLNYMAFVSQEIERIRINTDKIIEKIGDYQK